VYRRVLLSITQNVFGIVKQAKAKKGHFYAVFILQNNLNLLGLSKKYCFEKLPAENIYNIL